MWETCMHAVNQENSYIICHTHKHFEESIGSWKVIKFNQKAWLKSYINMNVELRKKSKNDFEKNFLKLMNNSVLGKTRGSMMKHRNMKLGATYRRWNHLVLEPNYFTTKWFSKNWLAIKRNEPDVKMNKQVYLGLSIIRMAMYEYWYDYGNSKYGDKEILCCTNMDSFIVHIKSKDVYDDLADDGETWFDASNYEVEIPLLIGKNKQVIEVMKDVLDRRIRKDFMAFSPKIYSYLTNYGYFDKK